MELIETVVKNSHHNRAKPFKRGAMLKGQMIIAKSMETGMLLEIIDKMVEVQRFPRTRPRLTSRSVAVCQLI